MSATLSDSVQLVIARAAKEEAQKLARTELKRRRETTQAKEKARKLAHRRRLHLGQLVIDAGAGDWSDADILTSLGQAAIVSEHEGGPLRLGALSLEHSGELGALT